MSHAGFVPETAHPETMYLLKPVDQLQRHLSLFFPRIKKIHISTYLTQDVIIVAVLLFRQHLGNVSDRCGDISRYSASLQR
jgi:hypothetical protein